MQKGAALFVAAILVVVSACSDDGGISATSCATPAPDAPAACWTQTLSLGNGGFPPSPGSDDTPVWGPGKFPLTLPPRLAFNSDLWMTAQTVSYSSPDGLTWTEHSKTDWGERIYHVVVFFQNKLWMYGGLDYATGIFLNDIWSSSDGVTWDKVGAAAWPARGAQAMVVYQNKLWLFGGADRVGADKGTTGFLNDVWVSDDGMAWTEVTSNAPWSPRAYPGVVELDGALYMIGGEGLADVWQTSDGEQWAEVNPAAEWEPRSGFGRIAFDGNLWVFGGWVGEDTTNALNDVWYSSDGVTWEQQAEHAAWAPRSPVSVVFDDKLWIFSGKHTGADDNWGGDLWQMTAQA